MTDIQAEFEIWATSRSFNLTKSSDGTYVYQPAFYAFLGWSESRKFDLTKNVVLHLTVPELDMEDI